MAELFFKKTEGGRRFFVALDKGNIKTGLTGPDFTGCIIRPDDGASYPLIGIASAEKADHFYYQWPTAWATLDGWYSVTLEVHTAGPKFDATLHDKVYVSDKLWDDVSLDGTAVVEIDASAIADEVWDRQLSLHQISGSTGKKLDDLVVHSGSAIDPTAIAEAVWNALGIDYTAVGSMGALQNQVADLVAKVMALPDASGIADQVWDEELAAHQLGGSTGEGLTLAAATADPSAIADAVWDELRIEHTAVGSFGEYVNVNLDAIRLEILSAVVNGNIHGYTLGETVDLVRKIATNRLELADGDVDNLVLYDDDGTTPLIVWDQKDKAAGAIEIPLKGPARRGLPDYTGV